MTRNTWHITIDTKYGTWKWKGVNEGQKEDEDADKEAGDKEREEVGEEKGKFAGLGKV